MLTLKDFFGLSIDENTSDIHSLLEKLSISTLVKESKVVKGLSKTNGADAAIVAVAIRQQTLKQIKFLLNETMLEYDPNFYTKEINTSSEHDRRYSAEDKLLAFALVTASTKSPKVMLNDSKFMTVKQLRDAAIMSTRFDRCWDVLSHETEHIISAFRKKN